MAKTVRLFILEIIILLISGSIVYSQAPNDTLTSESSNFVVKISRSWELPQELKEISGISYIDAERIACVQDEMGAIYIYNLALSSIEATIPFGPPGDYEGIATVNDNAYVACADGRIYEVAGYRTLKPSIKEYGTHLTVKQNVEGICYDKTNNRLLVSIKGQEEGSPPFKGIYEFGLANKKMPVKPVIKIDLQHQVFGRSQLRKLQSVIQPSDVDINPVTGDIYLTDGEKSQLLIMGSSGKIKALYALSKTQVIQPEGICFTPSGELYIASEGKKQEPAKLLLAELP
jgi:uncharacterized protein YjiK